jgi:hypothetical protein
MSRLSRFKLQNVWKFNKYSGQFSTQTNQEKELIIYSTKKLTPVSLKSLMDTGKGERLDDLGSSNRLSHATASQKVLTQVACFLHRELPVRLAHRAVRLESSSIFAKNGTLIIDFRTLLFQQIFMLNFRAFCPRGKLVQDFLSADQSVSRTQ